MEITWTFVVLEVLALAVVKAVEGEVTYWGGVVSERLWLYLRAILTVAAFVVSQLYPTAPNNALLVLSALAIGLGVLGYWPEVQQVGRRVKGYGYY